MTYSCCLIYSTRCTLLRQPLVTSEVEILLYRCSLMIGRFECPSKIRAMSLFFACLLYMLLALSFCNSLTSALPGVCFQLVTLLFLIKQNVQLRARRGQKQDFQCTVRCWCKSSRCEIVVFVFVSSMKNLSTAFNAYIDTDYS